MKHRAGHAGAFVAGRALVALVVVWAGVVLAADPDGMDLMQAAFAGTNSQYDPLRARAEETPDYVAAAKYHWETARMAARRMKEAAATTFSQKLSMEVMGDTSGPPSRLSSALKEVRTLRADLNFYKRIPIISEKASAVLCNELMESLQPVEEMVPQVFFASVSQHVKDYIQKEHDAGRLVDDMGALLCTVENILTRLEDIETHFAGLPRQVEVASMFPKGWSLSQYMQSRGHCVAIRSPTLVERVARRQSLAHWKRMLQAESDWKPATLQSGGMDNEDRGPGGASTGLHDGEDDMTPKRKAQGLREPEDVGGAHYAFGVLEKERGEEEEALWKKHAMGIGIPKGVLGDAGGRTPEGDYQLTPQDQRTLLGLPDPVVSNMEGWLSRGEKFSPPPDVDMTPERKAQGLREPEDVGGAHYAFGLLEKERGEEEEALWKKHTMGIGIPKGVLGDAGGRTPEGDYQLTPQDQRTLLGLPDPVVSNMERWLSRGEKFSPPPDAAKA